MVKYRTTQMENIPEIVSRLSTTLLDNLISLSAHYTTSSHDPFDVSKYPIPRFASAYGILQSLPNAESILKQATSSVDLSTKSSFLLHRQHEFTGYQEMQDHIGLMLNLPSSSNKSHDKTFILYSQVRRTLVKWFYVALF